MNNDKYKILIIMGKSGAGKDTLARALTQALLESEMIVSCTTRPIRDNEQNGVDYHFLTHDEFAEQINNGEMIEATIFNDWCYGTSINNLSKDKLNIAFLICGGLGDICIAANYLWYFRNHFANQNIQLDVYVRNDFKMVQSIFQPWPDQLYLWTEETVAV